MENKLTSGSKSPSKAFHDGQIQEGKYPIKDLEFHVYNSAFKVIEQLKLKKLGTKFRLLYIPDTSKGFPESLEKVHYVMKGNYPNLDNITFLCRLISSTGVLEIAFRNYRKPAGTDTISIAEQNIRKLIGIQSINLKEPDQLDPLEALTYLEADIDMVAFPYFKYSMFESETASLDQVERILKQIKIPVMIF